MAVIVVIICSGSKLVAAAKCHKSLFRPVHLGISIPMPLRSVIYAQLSTANCISIHSNKRTKRTNKNPSMIFTSWICMSVIVCMYLIGCTRAFTCRRAYSFDARITFGIMDWNVGMITFAYKKYICGIWSPLRIWNRRGEGRKGNKDGKWRIWLEGKRSGYAKKNLNRVALRGCHFWS